MPNHNVTAVLSADEMSFPIDYETRTGKRALRQANIFITICCSFIYLLFNLLVNSERKTGKKREKLVTQWATNLSHWVRSFRGRC